MIEIMPHRMNGLSAGDLIRMPALIPVMYALVRFGHLPQKNRPITNSVSSVTQITTKVGEYSITVPLVRLTSHAGVGWFSSTLNEASESARITVMRIGACNFGSRTTIVRQM